MNETKSPFEILCIPEAASREEIDAAYRDLMSRFSEDNYLGSPLWDMAAEKRKAIQTAYDTLTGAGEADSAHTEPEIRTESPQADKPSPNVRIRTLLNDGNSEEALTLLNAQPDRETNPEWIYLRGMAAWKRGWVDEANQYIKRASQMAPNNSEFRNALEKLRITPAPRSALAKKEKRMKCLRDNGIDCGFELCCGCLCEGLCNSLDGC